MKRRRFLAWAGAGALPPGFVPAEDLFPSPTYRFHFPEDHGSHPEFRTEWWYLTGWLSDSKSKRLGFQITFFRRHVAALDASPSHFAAQQLLFAHAALSDPERVHVLTDTRAARAGFGLAEALTGDMNVWINDWTLKRETSTNRFVASIRAEAFKLELTFTPSQSVLLEGAAGYSRKGPKPAEASEYYSVPQLKVSGTIEEAGPARSVEGSAWLDREWSTSYLDPAARGWDWVGLNFDDGSALMAFVIRAANQTPFWTGASLRRGDGSTSRFNGSEISFAPTAYWTSPRSGARYPIGQDLTVGPYRFRLEPLMDDQEIDARASTGTRYWEGAVTATGLDPSRDPTGHGYLELTGYDLPLKL